MSQYKKIDNLIDPIIEYNSNRLKQLEFIEVKKHLSRIDFAKEYQTVTINFGRQVGYSNYIARTADKNDIILCHNQSTYKTMNDRIDAIISISKPHVYNINQVNYDEVLEKYTTTNKIWVDAAIAINDQLIENMYTALAGKYQQFILLG